MGADVDVLIVLTCVVHGNDAINNSTTAARNTFDLCGRSDLNSSITDDITASSCTNCNQLFLRLSNSIGEC